MWLLLPVVDSKNVNDHSLESCLLLKDKTLLLNVKIDRIYETDFTHGTP